jgi:cyclopropane-fatty-acyl-phospholipid synthase
MTTTALADLYERFVSDDCPVGLRVYDGSTAGPRDAEDVLEIRSPLALRYLATAPGQLGLVRAYVSGSLEVHGDVHRTIHALLAHTRGDPGPRDLAAALHAIGLWVLRRPPLPPEEGPPAWRRGLARHTRRRDAGAIAHHYDLSNRFYELVLGPSMVYSCAVFSTPDTTLDEAQAEKIDLICRKLDLQPGERLLDVGAGWGSLVRHAVEQYGVTALGVTLSRRQAQWAQEAFARAGIAGRAELRLLDYRDIAETGFDAIASVGAMEHVGTKQLGPHFAGLARRLRPEGRMLNHAITRRSNHERNRTGPVIDRYVFPDGELQGQGTVVSAMHDNGFEVRHAESLREHYAMTLREWGANLERHWAAAVAEVGEGRARMWRLYMAMARVGFDLHRHEIHQTLAVRTGAGGRSGMPLRPDWERARTLA